MFIDEDDLNTFEGWLGYMSVDATAATPEELSKWRSAFDEVRQRSSAHPKVGLMKFQSVLGEYRYAVAVRDGCDLWLTLWIRRSWKGEFFVFRPCSDSDWIPHTSYHQNGNVHMKSFDRRVLAPVQRQPLTGVFKGTVNLGTYAGHSPKDVGAICDSTAFSGVIEVAPGILGPRHGAVTVDLVEPGCAAMRTFPWARQVQEQTFRDFLPWIVIGIWASRS
jgi:hypothetical protein